MEKKIILFGATGTIGRAILHEALRRGHRVTAAVRDTGKITETDERLQVVEADILRPDSIASAARGHQVLVSAYGPKFGAEEELLEVARTLIEGVRRAGVQRLIVVGGAGSLKTENGERLMETQEFPEEIRTLALAHADAFDIYQGSDVAWTYFSPASIIEPGRRTGNFRIGTDWLVTDETGHSRISAEDYAVALVDEIEEEQFVNARFTVGY